MEIKVLENKKNRFVFELKGEGHTLANAVRDELWEDESVEVSAYNIDHPLVGVPKFIVETKGNKRAETALEEAIERIKKKNSKLLKQVKKEFK